MDADRFDSLTRIVAAPATRRGALGTLVAGGLLGALGRPRNSTTAQAGTCTLSFVGTVRLGPTSSQTLTNDSSQPGEVQGELSYAVSQTGELQTASLRLADGTSLPIVGQATGRSLQLRIAAGQGLTMIAVGVGENDITACQGAIDGVLTGPQTGDLGDWHAVAAGQAGATGQTAAPNPAAVPRPTSGRVTMGPGTGSTTPPQPTAVPGESTGEQVEPTAVPGECAAGLTSCAGSCVDLSSDLSNCGACGAVCESGLVAVECRAGVCERADCSPEMTYCGAVDGCRDLATDNGHCGGCQQPCDAGNCAGGVCSGDPAPEGCDLGLVDCSGVCVDPSSDNANCGDCGAACGAGQTCVGAVCTTVPPGCAGGLTDCAGICVDVTNDPSNCGGCGAVCPAGQLCQGKVCVAGGPACAPGLTACGGVCLDLASDPFACGACTNVCAEGETCQGGACIAG